MENKKSGITLSVKLLIPRECADDITEEGFWPKGILCRHWVENTEQYR